MIHLMPRECPPELRPEQLAVEAEIRAAFRGVTREGGVSWSETDVIDSYGDEKEQDAARALDREICWEELVDDPSSWVDEHGIGSFNFLDPIGFRYYMAPAMIRCTRRLYGEFTSYALMIDSEYTKNRVSLFTPEQARATARFVRFMIAVADDNYGDAWVDAYRVYWSQFEPSPPSP